MLLPRRLLALAAALVLVASACGGDDGAEQADRTPRIAVTTNVLGDVVGELFGAAAEVTTIMPVGANPHDFQASPRQAAEMREADILIVNGGGFEDGLLAVIDGAESDGAVIHEAISAVDPLEHAEEDEHAEEEDEHADEDDHGHEGTDPHFFTDPARMARAARGIVDAVIEAVPALDTAEVRSRADAYIETLEELDAEVEELLEAVPEERRVLVTNHEVFGYFADRYGFEIVGTVIPGGSTAEGAAARDLAELVEVIEHEGVPAIFADTSSPADLARTLGRDVGGVEVVELFSESLGERGSGGETYLLMVRTNAERIVEALS